MSAASPSGSGDPVSAVVSIRVETTETGWALSDETWSALESLPWIHLQSDLRGFRGLLAASGDDFDPVAVIGPLTRDLAELGTVEIRQDVVMLAPLDRGVGVGQLRRKLAAAGIEPLGLLVSAGRPAALIEAWRAPAARQAVALA